MVRKLSEEQKNPVKEFYKDLLKPTPEDVILALCGLKEYEIMISENLLRRIAHCGEHQTNLERVLADELLKLLILNKAKVSKSCEVCFHLAVCKIAKNLEGVWQPPAPSGHPADHCQHFAPL